MRLCRGNDARERVHDLRIVKVIQLAVILRHVVRPDQRCVDAVHRHDLVDVRNARAALDLAEQDVFLVCARHIGNAVHLRKIRVRAGEGDAAVSHGRIFRAVDQHLRLLRAFGVW